MSFEFLLILSVTLAGFIGGYIAGNIGLFSLSRLQKLYIEEANLSGALQSMLEGRDFTGYYVHKGKREFRTLSDIGGQLWAVQYKISLAGGTPTLITQRLPDGSVESVDLIGLRENHITSTRKK